MKVHHTPESVITEISPLTARAANICRALKLISPMTWAQKCISPLKNRSDITPEEAASPEFIRQRAKAVDGYIIFWLVLEAAMVVLVCFVHLSVALKIAVGVITGLRIVEIVQVVINVAVFDRISGRPDDKVASTARLLVLSFLNFIELCVCFGLIYAINLAHLKGAGQPATAFYLSTITQLTIGYGDVYPTGFLRVVAATQGIVSLVFLALVFGRFVATLPRIEGTLDSPAIQSPRAEQAKPADK